MLLVHNFFLIGAEGQNRTDIKALQVPRFTIKLHQLVIQIQNVDDVLIFLNHYNIYLLKRCVFQVAFPPRMKMNRLCQFQHIL